jgi:hypothetical protein
MVRQKWSAAAKYIPKPSGPPAGQLRGRRRRRRRFSEPQGEFALVNGAGREPEGGQDVFPTQRRVVSQNIVDAAALPKNPITVVTGIRVPATHGTPSMTRWSIEILLIMGP